MTSSGNDNLESKEIKDEGDSSGKKEIVKEYQFTFTREDIDKLSITLNGIGPEQFKTFISPDTDELKADSSTFFIDAARNLLINGMSLSDYEFNSDAEFLHILRGLEIEDTLENGGIARIETYEREIDLQTSRNIRAGYCQKPGKLIDTIINVQIAPDGIFIASHDKSHVKNNIVVSTVNNEKQVYLECETAITFAKTTADLEIKPEHSYPLKMRFRLCQKAIPEPTWGFEFESIKTSHSVIAEFCRGKGLELLYWNLNKNVVMEKIRIEKDRLYGESKVVNDIQNRGKYGKSKGLDLLLQILDNHAGNAGVDDVIPELFTSEDILNNWLKKWSEFIVEIQSVDQGNNPQNSPEALLLFMISDDAEKIPDKAAGGFTVFGAVTQMTQQVTRLVYPEKAEYSSAGKFLCDIFGKDLIEKKFAEARQKVGNLDISEAGSGYMATPRKNSLG